MLIRLVIEALENGKTTGNVASQVGPYHSLASVIERPEIGPLDALSYETRNDSNKLKTTWYEKGIGDKSLVVTT